MNIQRGFFRGWIGLSSIWAIAALLILAISPVPADLSDGYYWYCLAFLVITVPPTVLFILFLGTSWILEGFKKP
jgi:NhaP-type Na+/H+ and K+/H+ antiporter